MDNVGKLLEAIARYKDLPTLRAMHDKIEKILGEKEDVPLRIISDIVEKDVALASRIIKIINSPFYGFSSKICSIDRAIVLMGFDTVKSILISAYVFKNNENIMKDLWGHSMFSALTARTLAKHISSQDKQDVLKLDIDNVFAAAIMHDIGKVIIAMAFPDDFNTVLEKVRTEKRFFMDVEKEVLGINHDTAGSMLMEEWDFPESIYLPVRYHHGPVLDESYTAESAILNIADILTNALGIGYAGEYYVEPLKQETLDCLSIDRQFLKSLIYEIYPLKEELCILDGQ